MLNKNNLQSLLSNAYPLKDLSFIRSAHYFASMASDFFEIGQI